MIVYVFYASSVATQVEIRKNHLCLIKQFWSLGLSSEEMENFEVFDPTSIILIFGTE
jgi:hypothetical protein